VSAYCVINCTDCDFKTKQFSDGELYVILDSGDEQICVHPLERIHAERFTGKTIHELRSEGRLRYKEAYICLECGHVDHYSRHQIESSAPVEHSRDAIETRLLCSACGKSRLILPRAIHDRRGCLYSLFDIGKPDYPSFQCPLCKQGELRVKVVAIS
jgi:hypothetical protein